MPIFGSRPSSRTSFRPGTNTPPDVPSRGASPTELDRHSKIDSIRIEGNLYDILKPRPSRASISDILPKEVHVVLRYKVSFILSKAVKAESIKAEFRGLMIVVTDSGDGQFQQPETESEEITKLNWTIWRGHTLDAGKEYVFEFNGELPPFTPRSLRTPSGRIEHCLTVRFDGVTDPGKMRRTRRTIEVWNPFSMDPENPRPGLDFHADLDQELVGASVELEKELEAFVRYPDQCYKGIHGY
jgi:hypothetical protein